MNPTLFKALAALVPIGALFGWSVLVYVGKRNMSVFLQTLGAGCLVVVVLTHVAEGLQFLPWMHWGEEHSAGHYLDLSSAILAIVLLSLSILLRVLRRAKLDQSSRSDARGHTLG
jgi:hypothetical protein